MSLSAPRIEIFYRSTGGESSEDRPSYYSKGLCLASMLAAARAVHPSPAITFVNDGPMPDDRVAVMEGAGKVVPLPGLGNSASYRQTLQMALDAPDDAVVYLAEDDYLYRRDALRRLADALVELPGVDYFTLYDHLDRYTRSDDAMGGLSRIFVPAGHHWRSVESTCMTFAARAETLRRDSWIHRYCTRRSAPDDRKLWRMTQGTTKYWWKLPKRTLVGPVPSLATHMVTPFLAPGISWEDVARGVLANAPPAMRPLGLPRADETRARSSAAPHSPGRPER